MDKTEVTVSKQREVDLGVRVYVRFVVKGIVAPHQVSTIKDRVRRADRINLLQEVHAADLTARNVGAWIWQPCTLDLAAFQNIGTYDAYRWVVFCKCHHAFKTLREDPVISENNLAVFALGGNLT